MRDPVQVPQTGPFWGRLYGMTGDGSIFCLLVEIEFESRSILGSNHLPDESSSVKSLLFPLDS